MRRRHRNRVALGLAAATASVTAFALVHTSSTNANEAPRPTAVAPSLAALQQRATSLRRARRPEDVLPPNVAELLGSLPGVPPAAAEQSMRAVHADGVGALYVAPLGSGFAILSTAGFAGTAPDGLTDANPVVGGTATLPDGRLLLLGVGSDAVAAVVVSARGADQIARREGNGYWWRSAEPVDSDEVGISARLKNGRVIRLR